MLLLRRKTENRSKGKKKTGERKQSKERKNRGSEFGSGKIREEEALRNPDRIRKERGDLQIRQDTEREGER